MYVKNFGRASLHRFLLTYIYICRRSLGRGWGGRRTTGLFRPRPGKGNTVRGQPPSSGIAYFRPSYFSRTTTITNILQSTPSSSLTSPIRSIAPHRREATRKLVAVYPGQLHRIMTKSTFSTTSNGCGTLFDYPPSSPPNRANRPDTSWATIRLTSLRGPNSVTRWGTA